MSQYFRTGAIFGLGTLNGVALSVSLVAVAVETPGGTPPAEELRRFANVFNAMKQGYVEPLDDKRLIGECLKGMVAGIDSESAFLDQEAFSALKMRTPADNASVGLEIAKEQDLIKVIAPIEDAPSYRGGIRSGDMIVKIDETDVRGISLMQAVERLRGKANTDVTLTIRRTGEMQPLNITLRREPIKVQSVKSRWIEPGYAYVRLTQFQSETVSMMGQELNALFRQGQMAGLVLDLRSNPGGLLQSAIGVSAAFLPANSLVVTTSGRTLDSNNSYRATPGDYQRRRVDDLKDLSPQAKSVPMVVLVDGGSAAASEIVAGALQDSQRATIIGVPTFGRASIQSILPLGNEMALKLTTARWSTPSGRSVFGKGLVPDVIVDDAASKSPAVTNSSDSQVRQAVSILKRL